MRGSLKFYEKLLGGKILAMMPHEGTPAEKSVSAECAKILFTRAWKWVAIS